MRMAFKPNPGKIAVVREGVAEEAVKFEREDGTEGAIVKPEETVAYEKHVNPWALVVGVGDPAITSSGRRVVSPNEKGDKILIAEVGRYVPLMDFATNKVDYVYTLPFDGVLGTLEHECAECGFHTRDYTIVECPKCPKIEKPNLADAIKFGR